MAAKECNLYAWVDTETTGTDEDRDDLLEVAMLVTDRELNILDETGYQSAIHFPPAMVKWMKTQVDPFVLDMHTKTGLWDRLPDAPKRNVVEDELTEYLNTFDRPDGSKPRMAGSSVSFDRNFLKVNMPKFSDHFHHRLIDVSTVTGLIEGFGGEGTQKRYAHAAMDDIRESIELMQFYRKNYFTI